ncbi:diadenylate cyclase [Hymenobacter sp. BT730]|uniref:DNA integrity scanning protein DisA nucleotide-binding domain protein n=1 Tax=Hymenobacter sp. BT730 TaxID=3063332 RepID=UPI0026DED856|nr:diadenylate cyclase [Hymenobacter sp. BT730]
MLAPLPLLSAPPVQPIAPEPVVGPLAMWPHQARFRQGAQQSAQSVFDALDEELNPTVLLLGIPATQTLGSDPNVCLEPANALPDRERFLGVRQRGLALQQEEPWPFRGYEVVSEWYEQWRQEGVSLRRAVQEVFDADPASHKRVSFVGMPVLVHNHFVLTVLQLNAKVTRRYAALKPERYYTDGRPLATSLIQAVVIRFHEECWKALNEPEAGLSLFMRPRDTDELIRAAGRLFMDTPAQDLDLDPTLAKLFATCTTISSLRYEGAEGVGKLLLARRRHPNLEEVFALTCPTPLTDYRAVRKLLEMATADVSLLADGENVYALGRLVGNYDPAREDLFVINFVKHYIWEFQHDGQVLMRANYGTPTLPRTRLNRTHFRRELRHTFGLTDSAKIERLWDVMMEASRQKHGTLLVITTEALAEADRLKLQCTLIEPVPLTPLITRLITAIDGAVLLDPDGYCYSIGVILDGKATGRGTSTRGARYNSAIRYVESSPYPCLAVVVSEDGLVDVITKENLGE